MTTLLLVRHGETPDNARQVLQGHMQGCLNDTGIGQAQRLCDQLASEPVSAIIASDLHRAVQTAEIIARPHALSVVTTPLLRERDWGDFTGRYIPDIESTVFPDNVEPLPALMDRAGRFIDMVRRQYPGQRVIAVGHGIVNKAIQAVLLGKTMRDVTRMANGEVRTLLL